MRVLRRRRRRRQRVGRGLRVAGGVVGGSVGGSGGVRGGGVQRERVLQLQQLVVRVERGRRAVPALVGRAHHVAPVGEAAHVGRRVVVRVAAAHDALMPLRPFGVDVGEAARGEPRGAVPLLATVGQVVLQTESVAAVQQQTTFACADEAR